MMDGWQRENNEQTIAKAAENEKHNGERTHKK
jgi:hypothetical protein